MKKIGILFIMTLFLFVGCEKNNEPVSDEVMNFVPQLPSTKATASAFEKDDVIGVYISEYEGDQPGKLLLAGNYKNNNRVRFDGTRWNGDPQIYWGEGKYDVYAYYPYIERISNLDPLDFNVAVDQSTEKTTEKLGGYEASDLLWASKKGIVKTESIPLLFRHLMSKLTVNIIKGSEYSGDLPKNAKVVLHNTVVEAEVDLSSGVVVKDRFAIPKSIIMKPVSLGKYTAIVVPQRIDSKRPLIEVICNDVSYMIEAMFVFRSNVNHTINIILNSNPEKVKIEIGGEIEGGWN